jgi:hypothetical protein
MPLNKYICFCNTEQNYVSGWSETALTKCPNDTTHEIITDSVSLIDSIQTPTVYLAGKNIGSTQGMFGMKGFFVDMNTTDPVVTYDEPLPITIAMFGFSIFTDNIHNGDSFDIVVNPGITIGTTLQNISPGDKIIHVSSTVFQFLKFGFSIVINDGVHQDELNTVVAMDPVAETITFATPATHSFSMNSQIMLKFYVVKNYCIGNAGEHKIGYGSMGSKELPAGTLLRLYYRNNNLQQKKLAINYEYNY